MPNTSEVPLALEHMEMQKNMASLRRRFRGKLVWPLYFIFGNINISLHGTLREKYKIDYEVLKRRVSLVSSVLAVINLFLNETRFINSFNCAFLFYYYIVNCWRDSVLIATGSDTPTWKLIHHSLCIVLACITFTWPSGPAFQEYQTLLCFFCLYFAIFECIRSTVEIRFQYSLQMHRKLNANSVLQAEPGDLFKKKFKIMLPLATMTYSLLMYMGVRVFILAHKYHYGNWQIVSCASVYFMLSAGDTFTLISIYLKKISKNGYSSRTSSFSDGVQNGKLQNGHFPLQSQEK